VSCEDLKSAWNSRVRKAIRQGSAEEKVRKHRDRMTAVWNPMCQCLVSYDPSMVTSLQHVSWMDEERFRETCSIQEKRKRGGIYQPFYGTWVDFILRQDSEMLGKYLNDCGLHSETGFMNAGQIFE